MIAVSTDNMSRLRIICWVNHCTKLKRQSNNNLPPYGDYTRHIKKHHYVTMINNGTLKLANTTPEELLKIVNNWYTTDD